MKHLHSTLLAAAIAVVATPAAMAQTTGVQRGAGEIALQQILDQVIGIRYTSDNRYRSSREQEMFRRADLNRDGSLSRYEVDAYRKRMGYDRDNRRHRQDWRNDRGVPVREVDTNGDNYISRSEAMRFVRDVQRQGLDDYYDRREHRGRYNR